MECSSNWQCVIRGFCVTASSLSKPTISERVPIVRWNGNDVVIGKCECQCNGTAEATESKFIRFWRRRRRQWCWRRRGRLELTSLDRCSKLDDATAAIKLIKFWKCTWRRRRKWSSTAGRQLPARRPRTAKSNGSNALLLERRADRHTTAIFVVDDEFARERRQRQR